MMAMVAMVMVAMDMASARLSQDMELFLIMAMVGIMARGLLMLSQDMPLDIHTEPHKVLQAMVVTVMEVMDMVVTMARDLLSQDIMVVLALLSTRAVLTTMDLMAMVSTTMARGLLMLDTMAMDMPMVAAATSR